jgi:tRNA A58 N-methylase Trm61
VVISKSRKSYQSQGSTFMSCSLAVPSQNVLVVEIDWQILKLSRKNANNFVDVSGGADRSAINS